MSNASPPHQPEVYRTVGPTGDMAPPNFSAHKARRGLIPAQAGVDLVHILGSIDLPLAEPEYSTKTTKRARVGKTSQFRYGENKLDITPGIPGSKGSICATHVKAGSRVVGTVVDGTRDEFLDSPAARHKKYACQHPSCVGKRWDTVDSLRRAHPTNQQMHDRFETHVYYGVCEIPELGVDKVGKNGEVLEEAHPAELVLFSTETGIFGHDG